MQKSKIKSVKKLGLLPTFNVEMASLQHNYRIETPYGGVYSANSHAACYAFIGYQCAWLKCHYKIEFAAALMSAFIGNEAKLDNYERVFTNAGVSILSHQVNKSKMLYSIEDKSIRRPLTSLKGLGKTAAAAIVEAQPFSDLRDFASKLSGRVVTKSVFEVLVNSGAMDCLGMSRSTMLSAYGEAKEAAKEAAKERENERKRIENYGALDIFGMAEAGLGDGK